MDERRAKREWGRADRAWRRGEPCTAESARKDERAREEGGMSEDGGAQSNEEGGTIELSTYHK